MRAARCAVVVTDSDATNLEIALGARARRGDIPVIMRVAEPHFAAMIRRQFQIRRAFSATALASAMFCDLIRSSTARGRVNVAGKTFSLEERPSATESRDGVLRAAARDSSHPRQVTDWSEVGPDEVVLVMSERATGA